MKTKVTESKRLLGIDGLRGVAALAVVVYHLSAHSSASFSHLWPSFIAKVFSYGYLGVPVFFVLSGFVIAGSIQGDRLSFSYIGRFILRRSIRLDPVYWCAIILCLSLLYVKKNVLGFYVDFPPISAVFIHVFYMQDLLQETYQISPVFWTLCLEIQFYIFFILSLGVVAYFSAIRYLLLHTILVLLIACVSIFIYTKLLDFKIPGLFVNYWLFFALGVLLSRGLAYGKNHLLCFYFLILCCVFAMYFVDNISYLLAGVSTSLLIYYWALKKTLKTAMKAGGLQFLGRISYSLYLTHPEIGWKFISIMLKKFPNLSDFWLAGLFCLSIWVTIVFAWLFYMLIERPSLALSRKIKL